MVASSLLIWIGMGKNPIDSVVVAQACVCRSHFHISSFTGNCLGMLWLLAGLAIVCVVSFTSSASVALATNIPHSMYCSWLYHWHGKQMDGLYTALVQVLYYFIGKGFNFFVPKVMTNWILVAQRNKCWNISWHPFML
ncbi:uncharacterized protein LOC142526621 [Primulina tabacum]|uniref:uncharacterized protein LOC142526621 n=1 Tax=Primulina tabacum TaxID=48773 RepID=UPI003F59DEAD